MRFKSSLLPVICSLLLSSTLHAQYSGGTGTPENPYLISTYSDLKNVHLNLTAAFRLTSDIDASASASEDGGAGFLPIGTELNAFTGSFHGAGHIITHLTINRPSLDMVGLFGNSGGTIDSLGLTGASVRGFSDVGILAGYAAGSIDHCYTTGAVEGSEYVGGLVGYGFTIDRSFSTASVTGDNSVGGLVGEMRSSLTRSYATGSVTGRNEFAGGLVGYGQGIVNCYASGAVSGQLYVGGLAGYTYDVVSCCYSSGSVSGTDIVGAFVGLIQLAHIDKCHWIPAAGLPAIATVVGESVCADTTGLTAEQMQQQSAFTGWDFIGTWIMTAGQAPSLRLLPGLPMPVELTAFTAKDGGSGSAVLSWSTATEVNNYGFEVERKKMSEAPGAAADEWMKVGLVKGRGTSNAPQQYGYVDRQLAAGRYAYRLRQIDADGKWNYASLAEVTIAPPAQYALLQNYPNPFNPSTTIGYELPAAGHVTLTVYDMLGREKAVLVNSVQEAGSHRIAFDASRLSSGVYFFRLSAGTFSALKTMTLVK